MNLHTLKPRPGSRHRVKRLRCGESSGHGQTRGQGHKGPKARSGGRIPLGFASGQMPLIRRVPKRGFNNNAFKIRFAIVNLDALNAFDDGAAVDEQALLAAGLIRRPYDAIKILGGGELKKKLAITVNKASESAKAAVEKTGGSLTLK